MKLETLELAARLLSNCKRAGLEPPELYTTFGTLASSCSDCELAVLQGAVLQLLLDEQFWILLDLKRAESHALEALQGLTNQTEYLRSELEQHVHGVQVLLQKIEREEHLRRDREALQNQGLDTWISSTSTC